MSTVTVDNGTLTDYPVAMNAGTVDDNTQRVTLGSDDPAVTKLGTIDTDTGNIATSVATIAGAVAGTEMQVDVLTMPTTTVQDGGGSLTVDDGGSSLTVDGSVSISGSVAVTDNSGSLTVDNAGTFAVQAAQSGTWTVQPGNTANTVAWKVDGSAVTQPVSIAAAVPVTDNSGSLTVDDGASSLTVDAPVGTPVFVRLSNGSSAITTLPVSLASVPSHAVTNVGTFAVQDSEKIADNAGFTDGTTKVLPTGYVYDEVAGTSLTENDIAAARIDAKRAQVLVLEDGTTRGQKAAVSAAGRLSVDGSGVTQPVSGTVTANLAAGTNAIGKLAANSGVTIGAVEIAAAQTLATVTTVGAVTSITNALPAGTNAIGKLAANSGVDIGDVDVTSVTPGTSATSLGKAEDAAHTSGDTGVMALAVRKDTATQLAGTDGDYTPLITNSSGALHVAVASGSVTASGSVALSTATSGGATPVQFIDVDESEDEVKGSAGTLYSIVATNVASGTRYLKVYDGTAAGVTVGSTTPKWTVPIPAGAGFVWSSEVGMAMVTGITIAATTGVAVADTGAPGANEVIVNVTYA